MGWQRFSAASVAVMLLSCAQLVGVDPWTQSEPGRGGSANASASAGGGASISAVTSTSAGGASGSGGMSGGGTGGSAPSSCGDANVDPGEECDDGDSDNTNGCMTNCRVCVLQDSGGIHVFTDDGADPHCYRIDTSVYDTWTAALAFCGNVWVGNLAAITDAGEQAYLAAQLGAVGASGPVWIGASFNGSEYAWSNGEPFSYSDFGGPTGTACVAMSPQDWSWSDALCSTDFLFLCER